MSIFCTAAVASNISAVWANDGEDKVTQDELRASRHTENLTGTVQNRVWNGSSISVFGARNEVISFNVVLEAANATASGVSVQFDTLTGPNGATISSQPAPNLAGVFNWVNRPIELFRASYVQIQGLSYFGYNRGDERQIPVRFQAPGTSLWVNRPDHDKLYPDALIPLETTPSFTITQGQNQSIWVDIYVPKTTTPGTYTGNVKVFESGIQSYTLPVALNVQPFALPDEPVAKTVVHLNIADLLHRYGVVGYDNWASSIGRRVQAVTDTYYQLFRRHKISLNGENECAQVNRPCDSSVIRLTGDLYSANYGYDGPGKSTPADIFMIGDYGSFPYLWRGSQQAMTAGLDSYGQWFAQYDPTADVTVYLQDEPPPADYPQLETWAKWMAADTGPGSRIRSSVTMPATYAYALIPDLAVPIQPAGVGNCTPDQNGNAIVPCNNTAIMQAMRDYYHGRNGYWVYNDGRPGAGSAMIEDDGIAMRTFGWAQWKMGIDRWYYWFANADCGAPKMYCGDWYHNATTFGTRDFFDQYMGQWSNNAPSNGNGNLVYPGTDLENPSASLNLPGPVASIRLKAWRRGVQDADYMAIASKIDPAATSAIVASVMPRAQWENFDQDPSYFLGTISWSSNPDVWEAGRAALANIVANYCTSPSGLTDPICSGTVPATATATVTTSTITVNGTVSGGSVSVSGSGCPQETYGLPATLTLTNGFTCSFQVTAPPGYAYRSWADLGVAGNPRSIQFPSPVATYTVNFAAFLPLPSPTATPAPEMAGYQYVPLGPCRLLDTRLANGVSGGPALQANATRKLPMSGGACQVPATAVAYAINATVVPLGPLRWLTVWPGDQQQPLVSTLNSYDGRVKANSLIIGGGQFGEIAISATDPTHVIVDITGYFVPDPSALTYHPLGPCRIADTRLGTAEWGGSYLQGGTERSFGVQSSQCGIPASAAAYALNYTAIPRAGSLQYVTTWPSGRAKPLASTLNSFTGAVVAATSITPSGVNGAVSVYGSDDLDMVIDVEGYFSADSGGLLYYPLDPCRVLDTRQVLQAGSAPTPLVGAQNKTFAGACGVATNASVITANATVIPRGSLAYLTLWPSGTMPVASTLNAYDGAVTSNATLLPISSSSFQAFATAPTDFILDVNGYFAP